MLSAQTPGTQIEPCGFAVNTYGNSLDIGQPAPSSMLHGMAHSVAKVPCLTAKVAFSSQDVDSFLVQYCCQLSVATPSAGPFMLACLGNDGKMIPQFRD